MAAPRTLALKKAYKLLNDNTVAIFKAERKATERNFKRAGGLIRGIARRSVRRTKKNSAPGRPPRTHVAVSGDVGAKSIVWQYKSYRDELAVGPTRRAQKYPQSISALEFGGVARIRAYGILALRLRGKERLAYIRKRPYIGPAGKTFERRYPDLYRETI